MDTKTYDDFVDLVRRMRKAQTEHRLAEMKVEYYEGKQGFAPEDVLVTNLLAYKREVHLEREVDEYLKKME